jgi:hypothetical protein
MIEEIAKSTFIKTQANLGDICCNESILTYYLYLPWLERILIAKFPFIFPNCDASMSSVLGWNSRENQPNRYVY